MNRGRRVDWLSDMSNRELYLILQICSPWWEKHLSVIVELLECPDIDPDSLVKKAKAYNIAPLAATRIKTITPQLLELSKSAQERLKRLSNGLERIRKAFLVHNTTLHEESDRIIDIFQRHDIAGIQLKGTLLAQRLYGSIGSRIIGDLDLLVAPEQLQDAEMVLRECGYHPLFPDKRQHDIEHSHHIKYHHSPKNILVELHWLLVQEDRFPVFCRNVQTRNDFWLENKTDFSSKGLWSYLLVHHHEHAYGEFKTLLDCAWSTAELEISDEKKHGSFAQLAADSDLAGCWSVVAEQFSYYLDEKNDTQWFGNKGVRLKPWQHLGRNALIEIPLYSESNIYIRKLAARLLHSSLQTISNSAIKTLFPRQEVLRKTEKTSRLKYFSQLVKRLLAG